jgi:fructokinase
MSKIVCFGEILIDLLAQPPATPDTPRAFLQYAGGAPANVAVAAARLGADTHFAGMLGQDMFGDFLAESLASAGVATDCIVRTDAAKTALAFVALDASGERSFSFYRPPAADLLFRSAHFHPNCFDGTRSFHVCSNSLTEAEIAEATLEGMRRARQAGAMVSRPVSTRCRGCGKRCRWPIWSSSRAKNSNIWRPRCRAVTPPWSSACSPRRRRRW